MFQALQQEHPTPGLGSIQVLDGFLPAAEWPQLAEGPTVFTAQSPCSVSHQKSMA
jgi:hypothetical protein